jgi:hypothetical protein
MELTSSATPPGSQQRGAWAGSTEGQDGEAGEEFVAKPFAK